MWGLFMGGGAKIVAALFGTLGFGLLLVTAGTLAHDRWELHKAGLVGQGDMMCTVRYEQKAREDERRQQAALHEKAAAELATANELLESERELLRGLREENERITGEYQTLAASVADQPSVDSSRCLSDGVLSKLRGTANAGGLAKQRKPGAND